MSTTIYECEVVAAFVKTCSLDLKLVERLNAMQIINGSAFGNHELSFKHLNWGLIDKCWEINAIKKTTQPLSPLKVISFLHFQCEQAGFPK